MLGRLFMRNDLVKERYIRYGCICTTPNEGAYMAEDTGNPLLSLTTDIVTAYVSNNLTSAEELPILIAKVHSALGAVGQPVESQVEELRPAVPVRSSVKPDYLICLEDGKKLKMLKRYLRTTHGMSSEQYRAKWKLPADYPMVAPSYSGQRRELAFKMELGRKKMPKPVTELPAASAKRRVRSPKAKQVIG